MIQLSMTNIRLSDKLFHVYIEIGEGVIELQPETMLLSFGSFVLGNDDQENELILYPGNFSIEFQIKSISDYLTVRDSFQKYTSIIKIYKDNDLNGPCYFKGSIELEQMVNNNFDRVISCSFYDSFAGLKTVYGYVSLDYRRVVDLILETPGDYWNKVTVESKMHFDANDYPTSQIIAIEDILANQNIGLSFLYGAPIETHLYDYVTKGDALKTLLNTFGSYAVLGFQGDLLILPRWYDGRSRHIITEDIIKSSSSSYSKKFEGLIMNVKFWPASGTDHNYHAHKVGKVQFKDNGELVSPDLVETIYLFCGLDSNDWAPIIYYTEKPIVSVDSPLTNNSASMLTRQNGVYQYSVPKTSITQLVADIVFSNIGVARKKYTIEVAGTNFYFNEFYDIPTEAGIFRPVKISYNYVEDTTELTLIECPEILPQNLVPW